jgi:hypothetical protein
LHLPIAGTSQIALMAGDLLAEQKRDAEEKLKEICDRIQRQLPAGEVSLHTNCLVQEALLTDAVEQMTSEEGYSLVVMGKTGSGNSLEELHNRPKSIIVSDICRGEGKVPPSFLRSLLKIYFRSSNHYSYSE